MQNVVILFVLVLLGALTACGNQSLAAAPAGDPARGKTVFATLAKPPCATCHTIENVSEGQIGPDLTHIASQAAERIKDPNYKGAAKDAAGYFRESIVSPNAFIAPMCPMGTCFRDIMPPDFGKTLTEQQLSDLIAFLLSQK